MLAPMALDTPPEPGTLRSFPSHNSHGSSPGMQKSSSAERRSIVDIVVASGDRRLARAGSVYPITVMAKEQPSSPGLLPSEGEGGWGWGLTRRYVRTPRLAQKGKAIDDTIGIVDLSRSMHAASTVGWEWIGPVVSQSLRE